ncbi:unnamed protein product [Adineta steineri]|uniref:Uncharacterized protein n=1 Tax=Adineta steineri TaxID=433720 RepID=A0A813X7R9_9BILA|nr:unnamed protein product [Adineta steineri]CAF1394384.1 unnamed protein product [Adineta steineri]CAF1398012.1 unnamed protein product [Adineta steineri]
MYAPPPSVAARRNRGSGLAAGGPLLAICCLGFILFLIAATIVLALIPVYLSKRGGGTPSTTTPTYLLTMNSRTVPLPEGNLDSASLADVGASVDKALNIPSGSTQVTAGAVEATNGKRKRRQSRALRNKRGVDGTTLLCTLLFNKLKCDKCGNLGFLESIKSFVITDSIDIDGVPYTDTFDASIDLIDHSFGPVDYEDSDFFEAAFPADNTTLPLGPVDKKSYPPIEAQIAKQNNVKSNQVVITSANVQGATKRKRRGFASMRERRSGKFLVVIFHLDDLLCPDCGTPTFYKSLETIQIILENVEIWSGGNPYFITSACYPFDITTGTTTTSAPTAKLSG